MANWKRCTSEAEFPNPHRYGMWCDGRSFAVFPNLTQIKSAVSYNILYDGTTRSHYLIYEWVVDQWVEIYEIAKGVDPKATHELWTNGPAPKSGVAVSDDQVNDAIASILGTQQNRD